MTKLYIDIETRSRLDIKNTNVYRYVQDADFKILMADFAIDDGPVEHVEGDDILGLRGLIIDPSVTKVAHNAGFERVCFSAALGVDGYLPPEEWHDTMAVAGVRGMPKKLETLAKFLQVSEKDAAGTALINFFCKPNRKGEFNRPEDHIEKWLDFCAYCQQDVVTMREIDLKMGDFPTETERLTSFADQRINDHGLRIDIPMARKAVAAASVNQDAHVREVISITSIENPNSVMQFGGWLQRRGHGLPDLRAETVEKALSGDLPDDVRRVLELRQELALVASKKFQAALSGVCRDGRLRGGFNFYGAHTGRWSGRGAQPQNLPREAFKDETEQEAAITDLLLGLGADALTLKKLVRPMFLLDGSVVDYSAIEARVIAWLAGEDWATEAFFAGRDIYVETANRMSTPGNKLTRFQGKVAVLALGYNGGVNSLRAMGATGSDEDLKKLVYQWRRANPNIVRFWDTLDNAFYRGGDAGHFITVRASTNNCPCRQDREIVLPSGRAICYHSVMFKTDQMGHRRATFQAPAGYRTDTYGGRLAENVTQAVARDILAEAILRLHENGVPVVGHVHDEVLTEDPDFPRVQEIMVAPPSWAVGLPIDGAGFVTGRYKKD